MRQLVIVTPTMPCKIRLPASNYKVHMRLITHSLSALLLFACSGPGASEQTNPQAKSAGVPTLEKLWVRDGFSAPEGVAAAPEGGYFISNVSGEGDAKDGEGWVSRISETGEVLEERLVDGMNAPKGMAVYADVLYVSDIDTVRRFRLPGGEALSDIPIDGAQFLNDATVWDGAVYVSDSGMSRIYRIDGDNASVWLESDALGGVNGLLGDGARLLITTMDTGALIEADADGTLTKLADGMIDGDGVGLPASGGYLVSAWRGDIFFVSEDGAVVKLLDTREEGILQNDLSVFGDTVIIPNWRPGTVTAWRVSPSPAAE